MEALMKRSSEVSDSEETVNNYAEPSLALASTFRSRRNQFKSSASVNSAVVQVPVLPTFVTYSVYILVNFYRYFLGSQVFYYYSGSIVMKVTCKID
jgi:hypothetical protein